MRTLKVFLSHKRTSYAFNSGFFPPWRHFSYSNSRVGEQKKWVAKFFVDSCPKRGVRVSLSLEKIKIQTIISITFTNLSFHFSNTCRSPLPAHFGPSLSASASISSSSSSSPSSISHQLIRHHLLLFISHKFHGSRSPDNSPNYCKP